MSKDIKAPDIKAISEKIKRTSDKLSHYTVAFYALIVLAIFVFMILSISKFASPEPAQDQIDEKTLSVIRPKIDASAIKQIEDLRSQNIDIESIFIDRNNPFNE
jgi:p-aminobenzoyl-glutamate transporter AbgT